jgi:Holliday junction resolvasome RuvABC DNA-binding subunit
LDNADQGLLIGLAAGAILAAWRDFALSRARMTEQAQQPTRRPHGLDSEAVSALVALGFTRNAAEQALNASGGSSTEERVIAALLTTPESQR